MQKEMLIHPSNAIDIGPEKQKTPEKQKSDVEMKYSSIKKIGVERNILTSTGCTSDCITGQSEGKIREEMKRNISERKRQQPVASTILKNNLQRRGNDLSDKREGYEKLFILSQNSKNRQKQIRHFHFQTIIHNVKSKCRKFSWIDEQEIN